VLPNDFLNRLDLKTVTKFLNGSDTRNLLVLTVAVIPAKSEKPI
jgi:hypothetical protein